ncbi:MAG: aminomethyl-transferring glycine dehydrogenase subunit GcvPA [Sphingomonadales bacterium]
MRYLPLRETDRQDMLAAIGAPNIDALFKDVPDGALLEAPVDLPGHVSELQVARDMKRLAGQNLAAGDAPFFCGAGAYRHHIPASVDYIIQRGEFLTAYTPYQPEIAQGTLQYLFEFQTQVARLFDMDVANASLYDGSTACLEAILMAGRITKRSKVLMSGGVHPHYRDTVRSMTRFTGETILCADPTTEAGSPGSDTASLMAQLDDETACVVVQYPNIFGHIEDFTALSQAAQAKGALLIISVPEPLALGAIKAPGAMGADIVVGEGQGLSVGLQFGGPYLGLFAARQKYTRQMPGRLCGETVDAQGKRGFVLTLSTREQHIRREKATSNICTNSGLCALAFTAHMALLGGEGLSRLAKLNHARAAQLAERLQAIDGVSVLNASFFNEFTIRVPGNAEALVERLAGNGVLAGVPGGRLYPARPTLSDILILAVTETATDEDFDALEANLKEAL